MCEKRGELVLIGWAYPVLFPSKFGMVGEMIHIIILRRRKVEVDITGGVPPALKLHE